jgi:hypothetical protein
MVLTLRRTRLEQSPAFADLEDFDVLDDGRPVGRIYEKHAPASPDQAWFWSITEYVEPRAGLTRRDTGRGEGRVSGKLGTLALMGDTNRI